MRHVTDQHDHTCGPVPGLAGPEFAARHRPADSHLRAGPRPGRAGICGTSPTSTITPVGRSPAWQGRNLRHVTDQHDHTFGQAPGLEGRDSIARGAAPGRRKTSYFRPSPPTRAPSGRHFNSRPIPPRWGSLEMERPIHPGVRPSRGCAPGYSTPARSGRELANKHVRADF